MTSYLVKLEYDAPNVDTYKGVTLQQFGGKNTTHTYNTGDVVVDLIECYVNVSLLAGEVDKVLVDKSISQFVEDSNGKYFNIDAQGRYGDMNIIGKEGLNTMEEVKVFYQQNKKVD